MFKKHHYLSSVLSPSAESYLCFVNNDLAAFAAIMHFPHARVKNMKRIHRLVTLPDYQGLGIAKEFINFLGEKYSKDEYRLRITTSHPSMLRSMNNDPKWRCARVGRVSKSHSISKSGSQNRLTSSWEYFNVQT
jgi:GNAT superfamily N-acetyltransferase